MHTSLPQGSRQEGSRDCSAAEMVCIIWDRMLRGFGHPRNRPKNHPVRQKTHTMHQQSVCHTLKKEGAGWGVQSSIGMGLYQPMREEGREGRGGRDGRERWGIKLWYVQLEWEGGMGHKTVVCAIGML